MDDLAAKHNLVLGELTIFLSCSVRSGKPVVLKECHSANAKLIGCWWAECIPRKAFHAPKAVFSLLLIQTKVSLTVEDEQNSKILYKKTSEVC